MESPYAATIGNWEHPGLNQDDWALAEDLSAGAVFDGLGGHPGSEHASRVAAQAVVDSFAELAQGQREGWALRTAHKARQAVLQERLRLDLPEMTAAAVFACALAEEWEIAWCGDCRVWRLRADGFFSRMTEDHNLVREEMLRGRISPARAAGIHKLLEDVETDSEAWHAGGAVAKKAFRKRHLMYSEIALGGIDVIREPRAAGDALVLTSDGVHDNLTGQQMRQIVADTPLDQLAHTLVEAARERALSGEGRAHPDDITCVVLPASGG